MAGRFQRLETSDDAIASPEVTYTSNYYDEPQNVHPSQNAYSNDDRRRMSHTTRKPVPSVSPPPPQSQNYTTAPEQPLMTNYFSPPPQFTSSSFEQVKDPFSDQKSQVYSSPPLEHTQDSFSSQKKSRQSLLSRTASALWSKARTQHVSHIATPLWAAPWRHDLPSGGDGSSTVRVFSRVKQRNRIFFHFFLQWLVPVIFCVALLGTIRFYSSKSKVSRKQKYIFNSLVVGFSLCLGFAVVNGMKEYMNILRWRLLARRFRSLQEFELVLGLSSQKKALRLMWVGRTEGSIVPNGTQLLCLCYLVLMLGLQIVIALLGLCYSIDTALLDYNIIKNGNVSIASLKKFQQAESINPQVDAFQLQSGAINAYGITGQQYGVIYQNSTNQDQADGKPGFPIYTDNQTMWWYWFVDQCPELMCTTVYTTDRWVSSKASCHQYNVSSGGYVDSENVTYTNQNKQREYISYMGGELSATTTWYANTIDSCGDRCTSLYALNVGWVDEDTGEVWHPQVFQCNNTISQIGNSANLTDSDAYQLPDEQARLVAGAIGYNGASWEAQNLTYQARTYDTGSLWSWTRMNGAAMTPTDMANLVMHFSTGAVAAIDFGGPRQFVTGDSPVAAQQVSVHWNWAILILILVPGIQFLVLLVAVVWGNEAVVRDGSFLSTAALLRPVIDQLERSGCALTGDEICEVLGNPELVYGVRMTPGSVAYGGMVKGSDEGVMHLDVIPESENLNAMDLGWRVGMKMPQGRYDGLKNVGKSTRIAAAAVDVDGIGEVGVRKRRKSF